MSDWRDRAECGQMDPELWFPISPSAPLPAEARAACRRCEVRAQCLDYSIRGPVETGYWAGLGEDARLEERKRRRRRHLGAVA